MSNSKINTLLLLCFIVISCQSSPDKFNFNFPSETSQNESTDAETIHNDTSSNSGDDEIESNINVNPVQTETSVTVTNIEDPTIDEEYNSTTSSNHPSTSTDTEDNYSEVPLADNSISQADTQGANSSDEMIDTAMKSDVETNDKSDLSKGESKIDIEDNSSDPAAEDATSDSDANISAVKESSTDTVVEYDGQSSCDFQSRADVDVMSDADRFILVETTLKTEKQLLNLTDTGIASSKTPGFRVIFTKPGSTTTTTRIYTKSSITDDVVDASVKQDMSGKWILSIKNISSNATIVSVTFPAVIYDTAELGDPSDDILLEPVYLGGAYDYDSVKSYAWRLVAESNFAPLLMLMDSNSARIVWSANWPPEKYKLWWSYQHWMIEYPDLNLAPGSEKQYAVEDRIVKFDEENNIPAWMRAAFLYKSFLIQNMSNEGIWPVSYPDWLVQLPGSIANQLQNDFYAGLTTMNIIKTWKDLLPLTLMWGQMSEYAGACCAFDLNLHSDYTSPPADAEISILDFTKDLSHNGYHIGFYSRPPGDLTTETLMRDLISSDKTLIESLAEEGQKIDLTLSSWNWVQSWQKQACKDWNADTFYLDVLGMANQSFGDSLTIAKLIHDTAPQTLIIEGVRDIFPAVFLPDSALHAGKHFPGGETYAFKNISTNRFAPFPELGSYILSDRLFLHGSVNNTWQIMGKSNQYWGERQIFLLGHKFNMSNPFDDWSDISVANPVLLKAIEARDNVNFWSRSPRYFANLGLTNIPDNIQASRFIDKDGMSLIAISNPLQLTEHSLDVDGKPVTIPSDVVSIIEIISE